MNGTTTSAIQALIPASRAALTRNWIPSLIFGILGIAGTVENILIIVVVNRGRLIQKAHHYVIMQSLAGFGVFNSLVTTCIGLKRYILYASGGNEVSTAERCMLDLFALELSTTWPVLCTLLMAIDRFFGVAFPMWYGSVNQKKLIALHFAICFLWIPYIAVTIAGAGAWPGPLVAACLAGLVLSENWDQQFETYTNLWMEVFVVVVYVALLVAMVIHSKHQAASGNQSDLSIRVAKTTAFIMAVFVLTDVGADCIDAVFIYQAPALIPYYGPWYLCMKYLPSIFNLPVYAWKNAQFREQLQASMKKVGGKVSTTSVKKVKPVLKVRSGNGQV